MWEYLRSFGRSEKLGKSSGWTLGSRDVEAKTSPYLVSYDELPDDIKELDRDAVRNIPALASRIGMAVYAG